MTLPKCRCESRLCKYYKGRRRMNDGRLVHYCVAFHDGIPDDVAYGHNDHLVPVEGQSRPVAFDLPKRDLVEPFSEEHMHKNNLFGRDNLCATIRNVYMMSDDQELRYWCRIAVVMAKNMYEALSDYKRMLLEAGVDVSRDDRNAWQLRPRSLYRNVSVGKNEH